MVRKYALIKKCALITKPRPLYVKYCLLFPHEVTGMAASDGGDAVYFHPSIIRGHHFYKDIWSPRTGEILEAARECGNRHDRHAVSLLKADVIVGHVPRQLSRVLIFFLSHGGKITCEVTGRRKFGNDLEVPCTYKFTGSEQMVLKMKEIVMAKTKTASR